MRQQELLTREKAKCWGSWPEGGGATTLLQKTKNGVPHILQRALNRPSTTVTNGERQRALLTPDGAEPKSLKTRYETAPQLLRKLLELTNTPLPPRLSSGSQPRPALLDAPEDIRRIPGGEGNESMAQAS